MEEREPSQAQELESLHKKLKHITILQGANYKITRGSKFIANTDQINSILGKTV